MSAATKGNFVSTFNYVWRLYYIETDYLLYLV